MTGCGRVGQNRLLDQVELHTAGCVQFNPVFRTLRKYMNRLRFRFDPKREKNRTEPDLQTLTRERLGEEIGSVYNTRSVTDNKKLGFNVGANEMITDIYMFGFAMIRIID